MNKYFYTLLTAVALLMAVSCSQVEELFSGGSGKTEQVSFAVTAGQVQSRTAGDGNTVDQVHYEVWDKITGQLVVSSITGVNGGAPVEMLKGQASVRLNLVRGVPYDIAFWAHNEQDTAYDINDGLENITVKPEIMANKESYDAFCQTMTDYRIGAGTTRVDLTRPFAQVNIGTALADWQKALDLEVMINLSTVTVSGVANVFDARLGKASGNASLTYLLNDVLPETFEVEGDDYKYLGMNYMLADGEKTLHSLSITLYDGDKKVNTLRVNNMPIRRNWRTNIVGNLLTSKEEFKVVIEPGFTADKNGPFEMK